MFSKALIIGALIGAATFAQGNPQEHKVPLGLQLRIILLNNLTYVKSEMLNAFTKANAPALHDRVTAAIVSAIRAKSEQSEADFAASVGVSVEELQQAEREGTGLDRSALEKMWGLGLLSVEELVILRRDVVVAALSEAEKSLILSRASTIVKQVLTILKYIQLDTRKADSVQLPAVEDILHKVRDDYRILVQLATEHYPEIKKFINLEDLNDELITGIATATSVADQLRHHLAFMFFQQQINDWREAQAAEREKSDS